MKTKKLKSKKTIEIDYKDRIFHELLKESEKKIVPGMAILGFNGANIVINSTDVDKLHELLTYFNMALTDSICKCNRMNLPFLASELEYIQCHLELSINHIIEL